MSDGLKSAFDLAMSRLEQKEGKRAPLSREQKQAMAEVESKARAATAELEIMMQKQLEEAQAGGDAEKLQLLQDRKTNELRKIKARTEADKERIRAGGA